MERVSSVWSGRNRYDCLDVHGSSSSAPVYAEPRGNEVSAPGAVERSSTVVSRAGHCYVVRALVRPKNRYCSRILSRLCRCSRAASCVGAALTQVQTATCVEFSWQNTCSGAIPTGFSTWMWIEKSNFRNITFRILLDSASSTKIVAEGRMAQ